MEKVYVFGWVNQLGILPTICNNLASACVCEKQADEGMSTQHLIIHIYLLSLPVYVCVNIGHCVSFPCMSVSENQVNGRIPGEQSLSRGAGPWDVLVWWKQSSPAAGNVQLD